MEPHPPIIEPPQKKDTSWHNAIANYMSRRIRHIHASSNEWYRVHRSGGSSGNGGGNGWNGLFYLACIAFGCWVAYQAFIWVVDLLRTLMPVLVVVGVLFVLSKVLYGHK